MSFRRILVANRGEIACRVMRTIRSLGGEAAAIHSEADRGAPHVVLADVAREIGPPPARESYLDIGKVVAAAKAMDCDAIHPGYGFLSENAAFAAACRDAGLVFIGPPPEAITAMGDKAAARRIATRVGVSPVPGYEGGDDDATIAREATKIGFPLLVKAVKGGGGKGLRLVRHAADFGAELAAARREAEAAFGDGTVLLERYVRPARHVEVQILADRHGTVIPVLERECSLQRRHQKVIEECPSAVVSPELRRRLGDAACRLAKAVGYVSAGTLEFLLEDDGRFWFLEMNTRLQVEHGVTELVTGEDLVAWQIRIAAGERLNLPPDLAPHGAAIEARIYAEDPDHGFLPQAGLLRHLVFPSAPGIRVDAGVRAGQEISPWYDPMIAKVMAFGRDREEARRRLVHALRATEILGPANNVGYLISILEGEAFRTAKTYTHTLGEDGAPKPPAEPPLEVLVLAAGALARTGSASPRAAKAGGPGERGSDSCSPFEALGAFRLVPSRKELP